MITPSVPGFKPFTDPQVAAQVRWLRFQAALLLLLAHAGVLATWLTLGHRYAMGLPMMVGLSVVVVARRSGWSWRSSRRAALEVSGLLALPAVAAQWLRGDGLPLSVIVPVVVVMALVQVRWWAPKVASCLEASQSWRVQ